MSRTHTISGTLEDYLETILKFEHERRPARVSDIAEDLSVHKSTVSLMLRSLAGKHLVNYSPYEITTLTDRGRRIAEEVTESHAIIGRFLAEVLLVEKGLAGENACRMEHVMDKEVMDRLVLFARFIKSCPRAGEDWLGKFAAFVKRGGEVKPDPAKAEQFLRRFRRQVKRTRAQADGRRRKMAGRGSAR